MPHRTLLRLSRRSLLSRVLLPSLLLPLVFAPGRAAAAVERGGPAALAGPARVAARQVVALDTAWRFTLSDPAGAEAPAWDDATWRLLDVPHDWAFEAPYEEAAAQGEKGGYKPGGVGWYRRSFDCPAEWADREVRIEFDGVYMNSTVWLNGQPLGRRPYGYGSFGYDLRPQLRPGRNVLAVRVDNSREPSARWYHGCGIYAPVRLVVTGAVRVAPSGVAVTTPALGPEQATVSVRTELENRGPEARRGRLVTRLFAPDGAPVAAAEAAFTLAGGATTTLPQTLTVAHPQRWDLATPVLYTAVSEVWADAAAAAVAAATVPAAPPAGADRLTPSDALRTRFGFRTVRWDAATGFWLNERNVKLLGVCEHLEGGPVGAAWPDRLIRWKLESLRRMGANAIRTAHNPQVPRFYEWCDELGLLVMDEIFDGWRKKAEQDYGAQAFADWWERDLRDWLRRDRNHPSVVLYSLGNETQGPVAPALVRVCHEVDPTRLVTSGFAGAEFMDVLGVNGHSERQRFFREPPRDRAFVATEAPHTWQVRGFYRTQTWWRDGYPNRNQDPFPLPNLTPTEIFTYDWAPAARKTSAKQVFNSSYDNATVRISARKNWELLRDLPWFSGHFRWTGFDYLGEAGYVHGGWPFRAFMGGALDLAGFEKDLFYLYQSQWTTAPMVHLLPSWTHPRLALGTPVPVQAYSNAEEVELFRDGRTLGRRRPGRRAEDMACQWLVPWQPGTLEAIAYRGGREVARTRQRTASAPAALRVDTDQSALAVDGQDVAVVTLAQVDAAGTLYPYGENRIGFRLEGPARLLALENGNPVDTEPNWGPTSRRAFFGLARAFVQATRAAGDVALVAGAILGERRQLTSNRVHVDVRRVWLRGAPAAAAQPPAWQIHYTVDGREPTPQSPRYAGPFTVPLGTTVRALVREAGRDVLRLEETFAADAGLHWPAPGEAATVAPTGRQAEDATLTGAHKEGQRSGFYGTGYAVVPAGGAVTWYEENDGGSAPVWLRVRYATGDDARGPVPEIRLTANGQALPAVALAATAEGRWHTCAVPARLERGANHVRLEVRAGAPLLVDELVLEPAAGIQK